MADKPEPESTARLSAARKRLWTAISDYVHGQGGWVTSPPYSRFLRIEVEQGSSLPVQLEKAGHSLRRAGITTRSGPGFRTVDVWNWIYQEGNR